MAKSKFDYSLLEPLEENNHTFDMENISPEMEDSGSYLDNLPEEEGFWGKLPRNILIGLSNLGHKTINTPHELAALSDKIYPFTVIGAHKLKREPDVASYIPHQQEYDFAKLLGQKGEPDTVDEIIQKGVEYAPDIAGVLGLARGAFRRIKGTHHLDKVEKLLAEKGIKEFSYPKEMIDEAKKFLPKTQATNELLAETAAGNYKPAFSLQSQVGHHQRKLAKSPLASENSLMAPKAGELKKNMIKHLEKILVENNLVEEAELLRKGIKNYAEYMKVKNAALPVLKYFGIPTTVLTAAGLGVKKIQKKLTE